MRYPRKRPESNHLLTVRGATLQILATCPVVKTFIAGSPITFADFWNGVPLKAMTFRRNGGAPLLAALRSGSRSVSPLWRPGGDRTSGSGLWTVFASPWLAQLLLTRALLTTSATGDLGSERKSVK